METKTELRPLGLGEAPTLTNRAWGHPKRQNRMPAPPALRSKTDAAMVNETLCKILCHNLVVLIHEIQELGINHVFWSESAA